MNMKRLGIGFWAVLLVSVILAASVSQAADGGCGASVDADGTVHIPEVNVNGAVYWATLQLGPSQNGATMLKATNYGPVADSHCANSQRTFYVESEGASRVFIPTVQYAGAAYWAMLELVPSTDGLLWFKVTGYGNGGDWSGEGGALLATMKVEVVQTGERQTTVRGRSPLGVKAEITTTLLPNQPASSPSFTHSQPTEGTYSFRLTYTVPYSDLPPEVAGRLRAASTLTATRDAAEDSAVGVVIDGALEEGGENILELIAEKVWGEAAAAVVEAGGNFFDVLEAWHTRAEHQEQMRELDRLEECAKNPPLPESPEDQQRALDELASIRLEIKMNTASRFVGMMIGTAAGLTPPVVDVPVVAGVAYFNRKMGEFDSFYLENARKVAPCKATWSGTFTADFRQAVADSYNGDSCAFIDAAVTGEATFEEDLSATPSDPAYTVFPLKSGRMTATVTWSSACDWGTVTGSPSSFTVPLVSRGLAMEVTPLGHATIYPFSVDFASMNVTETKRYKDCGSCDDTVTYDLAPPIIATLVSWGDASPPDLNKIVMTRTEPGDYVSWSNRWLLTRSPQLQPPPY